MEVTVQRMEIAHFLYQEAELLDQAKWREWLQLFSEDAVYRIPCKPQTDDPELEVHLIYDNYERLKDRVDRLLGGMAYAQMPASQTRHLITNLQITGDPGADEGALATGAMIRVVSNFIIVEVRRGVTTTYAGRCEHLLEAGETSWLIREKTIYLLGSDGYLGNLSFML